MKQFKFFIAGMTTILFIFTIFKKLLEVVDLWIETLKIKPVNKILVNEKNIAMLHEFLKPVYPVYDEEEDYCEDYDDFDED